MVMSRVLTALVGLVLLGVFAFAVRHAVDRRAAAGNRAEVRHLRAEIRRASTRLHQLENRHKPTPGLGIPVSKFPTDDPYAH